MRDPQEQRSDRRSRRGGPIEKAIYVVYPVALYRIYWQAPQKPVVARPSSPPERWTTSPPSCGVDRTNGAISTLPSQTGRHGIRGQAVAGELRGRKCDEPFVEDHTPLNPASTPTPATTVAKVLRSCRTPRPRAFSKRNCLVDNDWHSDLTHSPAHRTQRTVADSAESGRVR